MEMKQKECNKNKNQKPVEGMLFWEVLHDLTPQEELPLLSLGSESVSGILEHPIGLYSMFLVSCVFHYNEVS